jgi:hypothetical protein
VTNANFDALRVNDIDNRAKMSVSRRWERGGHCNSSLELGKVANVISVTCRTCGKTHQAGHCRPLEFPYCDGKCEATFNRVVERLESGVPVDLVGARPGDRVYDAAEKEIMRRRVRQYTENRQYAEDEFLRNRPRNLPSVAKRYFS